MQVAPGIHRLTQGVVCFYLIEDGGKLLLVDAGAPKDWDVLVGSVSALGRKLEDLDAVLLTHAHSDHTGFAERARTTAGAPVWIHQADAEAAKTGKGGTTGRPRPTFYDLSSTERSSRWRVGARSRSSPSTR